MTDIIQMALVDGIFVEVLHGSKSLSITVLSLDKKSFALIAVQHFITHMSLYYGISLKLLNLFIEHNFFYHIIISYNDINYI